MKRTDFESILVIGSGPIVIGQGCEFDYSGTQAVKALKREGYRVVLVNSNPATIMTDPELADRTYIEPITPAVVAQIIARERPDVLLPTMGGQTALNVAVALAEDGTLARHGVELIGAKLEAIKTAEDRGLFRDAVRSLGLEVPRSVVARNLDECRRARGEIGLPCVVRAAFTLGGLGGGIAYDPRGFEELCEDGLRRSMIHEVLVEESVIGWKEYELEVMRDAADNAVVVCSIENLDPMGVHTGDSVTVAPAQTLTDKEYQRLRDAAFRIMRRVGVDTGGANVQFAVDPQDGRLVVVEVNPRVSRSSALASKATGFAIAKIAALVAVGYRLDEIINDITGQTRAAFEPAIDYVVVKLPRFAFEKFADADPTLTTSMKSVGETMAIGRTFKEALQKALRGLETGLAGLEPAAHGAAAWSESELARRLVTPNDRRLTAIAQALSRGYPAAEVAAKTRIDPWFIDQIAELVEAGARLRSSSLCVRKGTHPAAELETIHAAVLRGAKALGFSDRQLGTFWNVAPEAVRARRLALGVQPSYKKVDTCAAEFEAQTPYYYSTYDEEDELDHRQARRIIILGGGPNRIGQGIEFDYCCCHAAQALRQAGYRTVMINSNPETVSTDYDTADELFFEPLTVEDVLHVCEALRPEGVIVQLGGQTPLNLAPALAEAGVPILGTGVDALDRAEDRDRFHALLWQLGLRQPPGGIARSPDEARVIARNLGFPVVVRPSYVLGGRAMAVVYDERELEAYMAKALVAVEDAGTGTQRILVDRFLDAAIEVDVDVVADGQDVLIGGVMEHIEMAGVHSGDSSCALPPYSLAAPVVAEMGRIARRLALALDVRGLMNVQFAVQDDQVYILEVNPRASRTVPFVGKATGLPLARIATLVMVGRSLREQGVLANPPPPGRFAVKAPVFPYARFPGVDIIGSPEMRSTGEVMGMAGDFNAAFYKALEGSGTGLPRSGAVFLSVRDEDKPAAALLARKLAHLGYKLLATGGTARLLARQGLKAQEVYKIHEGRPHVLDVMQSGGVDLVINTPGGAATRVDEARIRALTVQLGIPCLTTMAAAQAALGALERLGRGPLTVASLQETICKA